MCEIKTERSVTQSFNYCTGMPSAQYPKPGERLKLTVAIFVLAEYVFNGPQRKVNRALCMHYYFVIWSVQWTAVVQKHIKTDQQQQQRRRGTNCTSVLYTCLKCTGCTVLYARTLYMSTYSTVHVLKCRYSTVRLVGTGAGWPAVAARELEMLETGL